MSTDEFVYIWLANGGVEVADTNTKLSLSKNNDAVVAAWNFVTTISPSDNFQLYWSTTDTRVVLRFESGTIGPDIPSVICTVTQVPYLVQGPTGPTGPAGTAFDFDGPTGSIFFWDGTQLTGNANFT